MDDRNTWTDNLVRRTGNLLLLLFTIVPTVSFAKKPLAQRSVDEITSQYTIVGDFNIKPEIRNNSSEIFWRYPVKLPKVNFPIVFPDLTSEADRQQFPPTLGAGRRFEHLNLGRQYFLRGEFDKARKIFLGGKARYGTSYDYHRRTDFFIASAFLKMGEKALLANKGDYLQEAVRTQFVNASTFLSWSYGVKQNIADPLLDQYAPRNYYNLAAIYFRYEKWGGAFGAAKDGLSFLRRTGRNGYRSQLRRMQAEMYVRNRDYLQAAQELDSALQQDVEKTQAGEIFARLGDIYFDLNNFELAEEMYELAIRVDRHHQTIKPWHYILRGESLFWLGRFKASQRMMNYGLELASSLAVVSDLSLDLQALASIRIADSWLALGNHKKAKLAYFQHYSEFRSHETAQVAKLREACLELPFYQGQNINHSRKLLEELKAEADVFPPVGAELAWTCELASYAQHERTPELIARVRRFYERYPRSEFLQSLVEPLVEVQSEKINEYFAKGDVHGAVDFFEKTRAVLFQDLGPALKTKLFAAYGDIFQNEKAGEFIEAASSQTDIDLLRQAAVLSFLAAQSNKYQKRNRILAKKLDAHSWQIKISSEADLFLDRIMTGKGGAVHLRWISRLARDWAKEDFSKVCLLLYPVLRRIGDLEANKKSPKFTAMMKSFIDRYLADLFRYETQCALSVLEFEFDTFADKPRWLADQYLARTYLPLNEMTQGLIFAVAEQNLQHGFKPIAKVLWTKLVNEGQPGSPSVEFARSRLDETKMQTEMLWE